MDEPIQKRVEGNHSNIKYRIEGHPKKKKTNIYSSEIF